MNFPLDDGMSGKYSAIDLGYSQIVFILRRTLKHYMKTK